jgi:transcriptional regulator GlxA family with amidase domain
LQRAIELIRDERIGLAEAAAQTGFADQSHLSRWVRRRSRRLPVGTRRLTTTE